ncbi:hypothetical protein [Fusibacter ferrireducens]|uniref:Uncharacterized protein n=1 Tax=Fusibacter ferrireducens TaxID=2785058 RepID=A0ABR9ZNB2_9FIRM|nr:hypothetical protein [Fusibacter ferrireducens]MBF4691931.1 hypothetical protein [Fusibacter ferrireducens]
MSKRKFIILILIEILAILLFKTIEYSKFSIPTYDITKLNILLGIVIVILGLFLLLHFFKRREDHYISHLNQADRSFYDLLSTELDARELPADLNSQISTDMLRLLYKNGKALMHLEHQSPRYFKDRIYDNYEDHNYKSLIDQLIIKYSKRTKFISILNMIACFLIFLVGFNFALNGFNFNANYFRISMPSSLFVLCLINILPSVLSKYFSQVKHWKTIQFGVSSALNLGALILLKRWRDADPSSHAILNSIASGKIEFIPNSYVLLSIIMLIIVSYALQKTMRKQLLNTVLCGSNLEDDINIYRHSNY